MVYRIENGTVVQVWADCPTLDAWRAKYLPPVEVSPAQGEPGTPEFVPAVYELPQAPADMREGAAVAGQVVQADGTLADPPKPAPTAAERRQERNRRIAAADWTQLPDAPLTDAQRAAWAAYRQELRDVTKQAGFPETVTWPAEPS